MTEVAAPQGRLFFGDRPLAERLRAALEPTAVWLFGFLVIALVAGSTGGFLPTTQGWTAVATFWVAAIAVIVRDRIELSALELTFVGALTAFTGWVALSNLWTPSQTSTMHEVQRNLAYLGVVAAGLMMVRHRTTTALVGGVFSAITLVSLYALGTRILPDRLGEFDSNEFGYRLATPITYWNGLGLFTVIGIVLALGFAARGRALVTRGLAAAVLPLLTVTLYFTFSRGAWVALGVGLVTAVAVDPRRLQFLAVGLLVAPWCAAALVLAEDRKALTTVGSPLEGATTQGHSLTRMLVLLALGSAATAVVFAFLERRLAVPRAIRIAFAIAVTAAVAVGVAAVWHDQGSPRHLADRAWSSFQATTGDTGPDMSNRLFQLSNNGRIELWKASWRSFERDRLLGNGAGTFWQLWAATPDRTGNTTEGHSLYAETLGEMGAVGLVLLVLALAVPLLAGVLKARHTPLGPLLVGAYVAWLAHAGIDWDWELVGVSAAALLCGVALLASARDDPLDLSGRIPRIVGASLCALAALVALPPLLASTALDNGWDRLPANGRAALDDADKANRWAPWSSQPLELRGDAWRALGETDKARAAYVAALDREPTDWTLWAKLADVSDAGGRAAALARAHALNPRVAIASASGG